MKINQAVLKNLTVFNFQALDLIKDLESEFTCSFFVVVPKFFVQPHLSTAQFIYFF